MKAGLIVVAVAVASCGRGGATRLRETSATADVISTIAIAGLAVQSERACWTTASTHGTAELFCVRHEEEKPQRIADGVAVDGPIVGDSKNLYAIKSGAIVAIEWPSASSASVYTLTGETPLAMALTSSELLFVDPSGPAVRAVARNGRGVRDVVRGPEALGTSMHVGEKFVVWEQAGDPFKSGDELVVVAPIAGGAPRIICRGAVSLVAVDETNAYCSHGEQLISVPLSGGEGHPTPLAGALLQRTPTGSWTWYAARWNPDKGAWASDYEGGFALRVGKRPSDPDAVVVIRGLTDAWRYAVAGRAAYVVEPDRLIRWRW